MAEQGVGARLLRKEDDRLMRGRGEFVADIRLPACGMWRSCAARSRTRASAASSIPPSIADSVFTAADLAGVKPIRAVSGLPGFKASEQPVARHRQGAPGRRADRDVRRADTRAEAEDIAATVELDLEELPAVHDMLQAREPGSRAGARANGATMSSSRPSSMSNIEKALDAPIKVTREIRTARQSHGAAGRPRRGGRMEQRGSSSSSSTPPRRCRTSSAPALPDASASIERQDPRHLARCRRRLRLQGHPAARGSLPRAGSRCAAAIRCAGSRIAASISPPAPIAASTTTTSPAMPTATARCAASTARRRSIPAPIRPIRSRRASKPRRSRASCRALTISTPIAAAPGRSRPTSAPILPYRGVARTGVCFALELVLDAIAREAGIEPHEVRMKNLVRPEQMPFDNITKKHFDSGDYPEALRRALGAYRPAGAARAPDQRASRTAGCIGVGFRSIASRPRTAPRSMPAGASRWCPATSRPPRA